mmetsp:Transcript_34435/g.67917  ORF Transcript_34435/g.67917 Transcript_34435/m.67917 type:complete len:821 (-) Transcript_34435:109-2571(-)|eukprot:CAMPEP_0172732332 /NCGR_PEP_ID=MMETSP1074-20121228/104068_1 /TAXON_ID=2916 /ORGANISM="Ceratium fusus, Strain PA161109" /LENGTH=820 /DNA_ID=CAMNT_0013560597 /DNA_START=34 /DNA_END=2496 /DNA_ORIENTATION=+
MVSVMAAAPLDGVPGAMKAGGWRDGFLSRHRQPANGTEEAGNDGSELRGHGRGRDARGRQRASSCSREPSSRPADMNVLDTGVGSSGTPGSARGSSAGFDQKAVLDQDRVLIEQLTQLAPRRERPAIRKPPPPPKVTPYRRDRGGSEATPTGVFHHVLNSSEAVTLAKPAAALRLASPAELPSAGVNMATMKSPRSRDVAAGTPRPVESTLAMRSPRLTQAGMAVTASSTASPKTASVVEPTMEPVVPRSGALFTAMDIDSIMDKLDQGKNDNSCKEPEEPAPERRECTQNFGDISEEFYRNHKLDVPRRQEEDTEEQLRGKATQRRASAEQVKEPISTVDSWREDDMPAVGHRGQLKPRTSNQGGSHMRATAASVADPTATLPSPSTNNSISSANPEQQIFEKLEDVKRRKRLGERVSPVFLKDVAVQAKPLFPAMPLEQLVMALRLFTSARHEDHDLYLRILGEIPLQIRGITPELLTTCLRVLWRLRLNEETYLELFSMEAMNMIRAGKRRGGRTVRAPRRAPAPGRSADPGVAAPSSCEAAPPPEAPSPFNAEQLIRIGNALSQLSSQHPPRFIEVYHEQFALAIPRMTREECELVNPTLAMSPLMHDPLRRSFLERCAQVDAGNPLQPANVQSGGAAPDISQFQMEAAVRQRRLKHFRNVYIIEMSIRKETFSFFSSLPSEVRAYLDGLHAGSKALNHEGSSTLASQVAAVLDQLGVSCKLDSMAGALSLHVVAQATNPLAERSEIVYECSDYDAFYATRQDDRGATPQHTSWAKLRHRLLQRLGTQLTHIGIWEWKQMSEAQRVNYMVKVQSLQ